MNTTAPPTLASRLPRAWRLTAGAAACVLMAAAMAVPLIAQQAKAKPSTVTLTGVTAAFRCTGSVASGVITTACTSGDGVLGDLNGSYSGDPVVSTARGAFFWKSGTYDDFQLRFDGIGGRSLILDLGTQVQAPTCGGRLPCRKNFDVVVITKTLLEQGLLVRPASPDGSDLTGGMHGIAVGQTVPAKLKVNFPDPGGATLWWTLRYNPRDYPGSSYVCVTRTGEKTWEISAGGYLTAEDKGIAELVASPDGSAGRTQTHEGWYLMPFSLTVVQP